MLTIGPELAQAMESGTLARWKQEIAARIASDFSQAAGFDRNILETWVRQAIHVVRRAGATNRGDIELYAHALFRVTEAPPDDRALTDFIAIMTAPGDFTLRIKTLRKAFPLDRTPP